jgi:hypothetical protein
MVMKPIPYTSTLPTELMQLLDQYAGKFKIPKNRIIEDALVAHFEKLKRAEYAHSFRVAAGEAEIMSLAEEGLAAYLKLIEDQ